MAINTFTTDEQKKGATKVIENLFELYPAPIVLEAWKDWAVAEIDKTTDQQNLIASLRLLAAISFAQACMGPAPLADLGMDLYTAAKAKES